MAHHIAAMTGHHWDAGHQGQQWTLYLLHDQFWCPRMAAQIQKAISNASSMKALMPKPQCDPSLLLLLWSCYTLTLPVLRQLWSWMNPQTQWTFWSFVTTLQNTSWCTWPLIKLWKPLLSFCGRDISQSLQHWPNSWGANFESNVIRELCEVMGKWKVKTSPYHAQTNGQVEWAHQTLMHMIGKLSKDQKVDWMRHLPEWVHAYNSMRSAITRYSPHYLMFGCQPCLPIDFYFPTIRGMKEHQHVDHYIADLCE